MEPLSCSHLTAFLLSMKHRATFLPGRHPGAGGALYVLSVPLGSVSSFAHFLVLSLHYCQLTTYSHLKKQTVLGNLTERVSPREEMESRSLGALVEPGCARHGGVQDAAVCKKPGCARCCWGQCIGSCQSDPPEYTGHLLGHLSPALITPGCS